MDEQISVIVPIYNSAKTLNRCVASIQASIYRTLEIILIDDGSTDASGTICDALEQADERIKVFHLKNGGVSKARNLGLQNASGEFIAFIDSDDYVAPDYFDGLKKSLVSGCQMSICSVAHTDGEESQAVYAQEGQVDFKRCAETDKSLFLEWNRLFLLYGPYNKLYLRKTIQDHRIRFPEDTSYGEDLLFNVQYLSHADRICYRPLPVYYYVNSGGASLSHKYRKDRFENGLRLNLALMQLFASKHFLSAASEKFVYQRIFDDAYNSVFDLWNPGCKMRYPAKVQKIRSVFLHPDVIHACGAAETNIYPKLYVFLLTKRMYRTFAILLEVRQTASKLRHRRKE